MQLRLVRYFLALVKEKHFARAADVCGVTQPTLSAGLTALERQLGKRLIVRDRRFISLTPEGQALLPWARQMVAAQDGMAAAISATSGPIQGEFRLGAIPAALPFTGEMAKMLFETQPALSLSVRSLTSREIVRGLTEFELDGGLTYLDHEPPADVLSVPLFSERYRLVVREGHSLAGRSAITVADAAELPLCLLHQGMQNRRILDARLAERGLALRPLVTADSYIALLGLVQHGRLCSIIPDSHATLLRGLSWARTQPLPNMEEGSRVGVIVSNSAPMGPLAQAVLGVARDLRLPPGFRAT